MPRETFREIWQSWLEVLREEPCVDHAEEVRHAFYAGACALMGIFTLDREPDENDARYLRSIRRELVAFTQNMLKGEGET